ncbi:ABC transporter ATP-binding protein [Pseudoroseicyclus aestuarii]|uniref:Carbohydrate ABC transporter ATP-binding protein (CUT1 family) n=1 Tax=Pseudoroseicyclus aestuarii TaxID=1795041 RepID=A0A318SRM0_9RHOB|nr:ABC transporter ATP-binding protein [Pseudoroseicyclus aestuarii]PYE80882.1 carbohydrate ABC transporter ATP-binding protein (CUT1 family) [Pseudoroseicyclus aestuarii]
MRLHLDNFTKRFDGTAVIEDLDLTVEDGEMLALLGPSGCGKSTTLLSIAGIYRADGGRIVFGDRDVSNLPSQRRNVGVVFQNYALYPHMSVEENIAFPLTVGKNRPSAEDVTRRVRETAELVHIEELMARKPAQLSGGQQQRVALARAIVRRPDVLLLDEPLANLDAKLRLEMRSEIRRIQLETGITAILVTHDQVEAMSMCDRVAIMDKGEILQIDAPTQMYRAPASRFVAGFLGNPPIVFLDGHTGPSGRFEMEEGLSLPLPSRLAGLPEGQPIALGLRPEHYGAGGGASAAGRVIFVEPQGREMLFDVEAAPGIVLRSIQPVRDDVAVGDRVDWPVDTERLLAFDAEGRTL